MSLARKETVSRLRGPEHSDGQDELDKETILECLFNTSLLSIAVLTAVHNRDGMITDFRIQMVNKEFEQQTNRSDLSGRLYSETYPGMVESGIFSTMVKVYKTGQPEQKLHYYNSDGFDKWHHSMYVKTALGIIVTNIDVTTVKKAEIALKKERAAQKRRILQATLLAQEEERKRIAENIHNSIGQLLYGLKLSVNNLKIGTHASDLLKLEKAKGQFEDLLANTIKETRRITHQLSPMILEDFGLKAALEDICHQFGNNINCRVEFKGNQSHLDKTVSIAIYRITQELMLNIMKHARAAQARVCVDVGNDHVTLKITDNGVGFDVDAQVSGIGIRSIISQVTLLNGKTRICSSAASGTEILITIPYYND